MLYDVNQYEGFDFTHSKPSNIGFYNHEKKFQRWNRKRKYKQLSYKPNKSQFVKHATKHRIIDTVGRAGNRESRFSKGARPNSVDFDTASDISVEDIMSEDDFSDIEMSYAVSKGNDFRSRKKEKYKLVSRMRSFPAQFSKLHINQCNSASRKCTAKYRKLLQKWKNKPKTLINVAKYNQLPYNKYRWVKQSVNVLLEKDYVQDKSISDNSQVKNSLVNNAEKNLEVTVKCIENVIPHSEESCKSEILVNVGQEVNQKKLKKANEKLVEHEKLNTGINKLCARSLVNNQKQKEISNSENSRNSACTDERNLDLKNITLYESNKEGDSVTVKNIDSQKKLGSLLRTLTDPANLKSDQIVKSKISPESSSLNPVARTYKEWRQQQQSGKENHKKTDKLAPKNSLKLTREEREAALVAAAHEKLHPRKRRVARLANFSSLCDDNNYYETLSKELEDKTFEHKFTEKQNSTGNETTNCSGPKSVSHSHLVKKKKQQRISTDLVKNITQLMDKAYPSTSSLRSPLGTFTEEIEEKSDAVNDNKCDGSKISLHSTEAKLKPVSRKRSSSSSCIGDLQETQLISSHSNAKKSNAHLASVQSQNFNAVNKCLSNEGKGPVKDDTAQISRHSRLKILGSSFGKGSLFLKANKEIGFIKHNIQSNFKQRAHMAKSTLVATNKSNTDKNSSVAQRSKSANLKQYKIPKLVKKPENTSESVDRKSKNSSETSKNIEKKVSKTGNTSCVIKSNENKVARKSSSIADGKGISDSMIEMPEIASENCIKKSSNLQSSTVSVNENFKPQCNKHKLKAACKAKGISSSNIEKQQSKVLDETKNVQLNETSSQKNLDKTDVKSNKLKHEECETQNSEKSKKSSKLKYEEKQCWSQNSEKSKKSDKLKHEEKQCWTQKVEKVKNSNVYDSTSDESDSDYSSRSETMTSKRFRRIKKWKSSKISAVTCKENQESSDSSVTKKHFPLKLRTLRLEDIVPNAKLVIKKTDSEASNQNMSFSLKQKISEEDNFSESNHSDTSVDFDQTDTLTDVDIGQEEHNKTSFPTKMGTEINYLNAKKCNSVDSNDLIEHTSSCLVEYETPKQSSTIASSESEVALYSNVESEKSKEVKTQTITAKKSEKEADEASNAITVQITSAVASTDKGRICNDEICLSDSDNEVSIIDEVSSKKHDTVATCTAEALSSISDVFGIKIENVFSIAENSADLVSAFKEDSEIQVITPKQDVLCARVENVKESSKTELNEMESKSSANKNLFLFTDETKLLHSCDETLTYAHNNKCESYSALLSDTNKSSNSNEYVGHPNNISAHVNEVTNSDVLISVKEKIIPLDKSEASFSGRKHFEFNTSSNQRTVKDNFSPLHTIKKENFVPDAVNSDVLKFVKEKVIPLDKSEAIFSGSKHLELNASSNQRTIKDNFSPLHTVKKENFVPDAIKDLDQVTLRNILDLAADLKGKEQPQNCIDRDVTNSTTGKNVEMQTAELIRLLSSVKCLISGINPQIYQHDQVSCEKLHLQKNGINSFAIGLSTPPSSPVSDINTTQNLKNSTLSSFQNNLNQSFYTNSYLCNSYSNANSKNDEYYVTDFLSPSDKQIIDEDFQRCLRWEKSRNKITAPITQSGAISSFGNNVNISNGESNKISKYPVLHHKLSEPVPNSILRETPPCDCGGNQHYHCFQQKSFPSAYSTTIAQANEPCYSSAISFSLNQNNETFVHNVNKVKTFYDKSPVVNSASHFLADNTETHQKANYKILEKNISVKKCTVCMKNATFVCKGCSVVPYCSEDCARMYWTWGHNRTCCGKN